MKQLNMRTGEIVDVEYVSVGASRKASADDVIVVFEPNRPHYEIKKEAIQEKPKVSFE